MIELLPTFYKADNSGSFTPDTNTADSLAYFNQLKQLLTRAEAATDSKRQQKTSETAKATTTVLEKLTSVVSKGAKLQWVRWRIGLRTQGIL